MHTRHLLRSFACLLLVGALVSPGPAQTSQGSSQSRESRSTRRTGQPVLPDPALFDGAAFPAEKRPERGMLGEFEMDGKEPSKDSEKVGGSSNPGGQAQGLPTPQSGAAGGTPKTADNQAEKIPGGGEQPQGEGGGKPLDKNDPNAKAEGIRAGELKIGDAQDPNAQGQNSPDRPKEIQIGDATMQIQTPGAPAQTVEGAKAVQGPTQQFEKQVGKGIYGGGDNTNKGVEKGRTMPPGM